MTNFARLVSLLVVIGIGHTNVNAEDLSTLYGLEISVNKVEAKIKEIEASTTMDADDKAKLIETNRKTISYLEQTISNQNSIQSFKNARKNARDQAGGILKALEKRRLKSREDKTGEYNKSPLSELDQKLVTEKANFAAVRAKLDDLINRQSDEFELPGIARKRLISAQQRQHELEIEYESLSTSETDPVILESRTWLMLSEYDSLRTEIKMLDQRLLSQPMRLELLQAKTEETRFSLSLIEKDIDFIESIISVRRKTEAQEALSEAEKTLEEIESSDEESAHKAVLKMAKANADLSIYASSIAEKLDAIIASNRSLSKSNVLFQEDLKRTQKQIEVAGFSQNLGNVLLKKRRKLPSTSEYSRLIGNFNNEIADMMLAQLQHRDEKKQLKQGEQYVAELLHPYELQEREQIRKEIGPLIEARQKLLQRALELEISYLRTLDEMVATYQQMQDTVGTYKKLLDERLIWVKSSRIVGFGLLTSIPDDIRKLLDLKPWLNNSPAIIKKLSESIWFILALLIAILIKVKQKNIQQVIEKTSVNIHKPSRDRLGYTFQVLLLSVLLALPIFMIAGMAGWEIQNIDEATLHTKALARALLIFALYWFYFKLLSTICREKGLADSHFRWPEASLQLLRSVINRFTIVTSTLLFLLVLMIRLDDESLGGSLGLLLFISFWGINSVLIYRIFDPVNGVVSPLFLQGIQSSGWKLSLFTRFSLTALSSALILFSLLGYIYGTLVLGTALILTIVFMTGVLLLQQLLLRWLFINHRRLALKAALERRAESQKKLMEQEDPEIKAISEEFGDIAEEPEIDLAAIGEDSRELLNVFIMIMAFWGLWEIWSNVMPAFTLLDNISLWNRLEIIDGEEKFSPVTLGNIIFALLVTFIIYMAIRKLPALMEIILLQRLDISPGSRFTIKTLINYALILIGILWISNLIGISWTKVQWLVAALSVGIGFGLQEIIANFICGIIILFERPIRIGDVVTIGDTDGVVTRIQIRATTIRNWDRKELLVPNKEFITGRLLNWSLTDRVSRIKFPIGIAYGSDVDLAMKLVEEAAKENSNVLDEPAPYVSFEEFGDNSLLLYLRCFIEYNDNRVQTITGLHKAIDKKFRDADISISFPQRDIHLDTSTPLEINLRKDT